MNLLKVNFKVTNCCPLEVLIGSSDKVFNKAQIVIPMLQANTTVMLRRSELM